MCLPSVRHCDRLAKTRIPSMHVHPTCISLHDHIHRECYYLCSVSLKVTDLHSCASPPSKEHVTWSTTVVDGNTVQLRSYMIPVVVPAAQFTVKGEGWAVCGKRRGGG